MLDLKFIRENPEKVKQNAINKNSEINIDDLLALDEKRRIIIQESDLLKNQRNIVSKEIAELKKKKLNADDKIFAMKQVSDRIKELDDELRKTENELDYILLRIPNLTHETVPIGTKAEDNLIIREWGKPKPPIDTNHIDIASQFGILDFERAAKVSGSGFAYYKGKGAALERALWNFMLDFHIKNDYYEIIPPFLVNENSMLGTGQLPKMAEDMYLCNEDNLYLIPTAEVPLTNFFAGDILKAEDLPIKICGLSACFRREAGSYGKDVHGFLRVHQFYKVELVKISKPEESYDELEALTNDAENILKALNIPYRVVLLCTGDTSFSSAKTYDLEIWAPGENKWLEVSSCSNFEDFQARRANIRFKRKPDSKPEFVHTLNGSGLATSRLIVSIIENYYDSIEGKIIVPEVLRQYCKFDFID